jgi:hypothetical protein
MAESYRNERKTPSAWDAFGKQLLGTAQTIFGSLAAAMIFLLIQSGIRAPYALVYSLAVGTAIGLVAGLYVRLVLRKSIRAIQLLAGLTAAFMGIVAFDLALTQINALSAFYGFPTWSLFAQIILTGSSAGLVETAWRKDRMKVLKKKAQLRRTRREKLMKLRAAAKRQSSHRSLAPRRGPARPAHQTPAPAANLRTQPAITLTSTPQIQPGRRKNQKVTLAVAFEEHRCPYCLQEVKVNDPRGVKICKVCGAWHHKDCWNITGHCQVPHSGNASA